MVPRTRVGDDLAARPKGTACIESGQLQEIVLARVQ